MHTAIVITDLTFGDAGKGTITDALTRRGANLVVRFNGGAQAAHTVLDAEGKCHSFHQFGSGSLVAGVETLLSRYSLVNPIALHYEERELARLGIEGAFDRLHIDARALVTTPYHVILNQLRELARGDARHGSCGLGIGETACDALEFGPVLPRVGDLLHAPKLARKLRWHRDLKRRQVEEFLPHLNAASEADQPKIRLLLDQLHSDDELDAAQEVFEYLAASVHVAAPNFLAARLDKSGCTLFEGAQGVLLDENWGFHPHTTWSTTTPANARQLIDETGAEVKTTVLGLTRAYATRHGAGPFPTEASPLTRALPDPHNSTNDWQGPFRAGWLDLSLLRYALQVCGRIDGMVMTCLDRIREMPEVKIGVGYTRHGADWQPTLEAPGCLARREKDGEALREVKVRYESISTLPSIYAQAVAKQLHLPLLGTSYGPTAEAKEFAF